MNACTCVEEAEKCKMNILVVVSFVMQISITIISRDGGLMV